MKIPAIAILVLTAGCSGGDADPVITPTTFDPATLKTVKGRVLFTGTVPTPRRLPISGADCAAHAEEVFDEEVLSRNGRLQNAFVYVKEGLDSSWVFDWPRTPVVIANEGCV